MALTRIRLKHPNEIVEENEKSFKLEEYDVDPLRIKLQTERVISENNLR